MEYKEVVQQLLQLYRERNPSKPFVAGETYIPVTTKFFNHKEFLAIIDACMDLPNTITEGKLVRQFERDMAKYMGVRFAIMTNSGSSANLLAMSALMSPLLQSRQLQPGDEVITVACGFPTTVNPIIQNGLVPVFVDINIGNYNATPFLVENAITEKTRAIFIAHTLGNPYDIDAIKELAKIYNLWVIEDSADALGAEYEGKKVGTFGNLGTTSFYPAHLISTGEGGMVFTDSPLLAKIIRSFRDWGRDCWCLPGKDNTCGVRFCQRKDVLQDLPDGYDHKYIYSHIGYNLKSTDLQASIGIEQLRKLPEFLEDRRENWEYLRHQFQEKELDKYFILPTQLARSKPAWFGFLLTLKSDVKFTRTDLLQFLEDNKIGSRLLFGGNLTKQPAYIGKNWRIADEEAGLPHSDVVMQRTFWIGVHPSLTKQMLDYVVSKFVEFVNKDE